MRLRTNDRRHVAHARAVPARLVVASLAVGLSTFSVAVLTAQVAGAATQTVTNCADSGTGSLRQAVSSVSPGDTINFALSPPCSTITLASTIDIDTNLTIDGPGATSLAVSGNNAVEVFDVPSGVTATISGLTVENGNAYQGGGITNNGTLTVTNSTLTGNSASYLGGAGIYNHATLTVANSSLSNNNSGYIGGGILNDGGTSTIIDSTFLDNISGEGGGGIFNLNGTSTVTNSTLTGNSGEYGGGIQNIGMLTVTGSTFAVNNSGNQGGGIYNQGGSLAVVNSTFSGNTAAATGAGGGIFINYGTLTVNSSTFWGNSAGSGAGVYNYNGNGATMTLAATIVANSGSGGDCFGSMSDAGYNLADDSTCSFNASSDLSNKPAGLDPAGLQNNGGPTQTIALNAGSQAIGHVTDASLCPPTDQRGYPRTVPCDIGAFDTDTSVPSFRITTMSLPNGMPRTRYSATLAAIGGNPPYKWSVSSGSLPMGLHLKKATGAISGQPSKTDSGPYTFTVKVVDKKIKVKHHPATQNTATKVLSITVS